MQQVRLLRAAISAVNSTWMKARLIQRQHLHVVLKIDHRNAARFQHPHRLHQSDAETMYHSDGAVLGWELPTGTPDSLPPGASAATSST